VRVTQFTGNLPPIRLVGAEQLLESHHVGIDPLDYGLGPLRSPLCPARLVRSGC
jgi:hypothetical protein